MNQNKNVVFFTIGATLMLLIYSLYAKQTGKDPLALNNVNLVADLVKKTPITNPVHKQPPLVQHKNTVSGTRAPEEYYHAHRYTAFYTDTSQQAMPGLMRKLYAIKKGKKSKVRIAWLGDSMIEGDLLTQTFRKRMQQEFGEYGVGFVPIKSVSAANRVTVKTNPEGNWEDENFKTEHLQAALHLSGHTFFATGGSIGMKDETTKDSSQPLEKALLCGHASDGATIRVNGTERHYNAPEAFNRIELDHSSSRHISVDLGSSRLPVYGLSFEPVAGVIVDNFSFRGISGVELKKLDTNILKSMDEQGYYDLVVLEYGVNVLYKKEDTDYSYYRKLMEKVLPRLHAAMPKTTFLIIGTTDRAFMYDGEWKTAIGIEKLIEIQARLAYDNNMNFYNMYESMGGYGTITAWANATPPMANNDYVHPNRQGAEKLGNMLFEDLMKEYNKAGVQRINQ